MVLQDGVSPKFEVGEVVSAFQGDHAVIFPKPAGFDVPMVAGVLGNRRWIAEAAGVEPHELLARVAETIEAPIPWHEVDTGSAPTREVVIEGPDVDLTTLPVPTRSERDAGPFIDSGLVGAIDLDTGTQNLSIQRLQLFSRNRLGILMLPRDLAAIFSRAESQGRELPVTISIGADPLTELSSQAVAGRGQQELEIAGALHGRPLEVVKAITSDVRVPANCEITIEGRIRPYRRALEGPFGEFSRYYQPRALRPYIEVDAVTTRRNPLYRTILSYSAEHLLLGGVMRESTLLQRLKVVFPEALDLRLPLGGSCRYLAIAKIGPHHPGAAKNCLLTLLGLHNDIKQAVVVDDDVDIDDEEEVHWAVTTRFQADRDLVVASNTLGSPIDPSTDEGVGAKLGLDATVPIKRRSRFVVAFSTGRDDRGAREIARFGSDREAAIEELLGESPPA